MGECFLYGQSNFETNSLPLENTSWEIISKVSESGLAEQFWQVGDEKDIIVDGERLTLVIMGFNHDDLTSGGKAGITFGLKNLMATQRQMNASITSGGGFTGSELYSWLQNTLLPTLPSDLRAVLKSVNKKTSAGNNSSTINTNSMKLFLFSEIEVFGSITYSKSGEGSQYDYFATEENRRKYLSNGSGPISDWWERSPYISDRFCCVAGNSIIIYASFNNPPMRLGVCFGFCV